VVARLEFGPVRSSWCLYIMLKPRDAAEFVAKGYHTATLARAAGWPASLARALQGDTAYADWVPSRLCQVYADTFRLDGRSYAKGPRKSGPAILYWEVAALADTGGDTRSAGRVLAANMGDLVRRLERDGSPLEYADLTAAPLPDSRDWRYQVEMGRAQVVYDGHGVPDTAMTAAPQTVRLVVQGERRASWMVDLDLSPTLVLSFPGGLRFEGKGFLADALRASPARLVGPLYSGGSGSLTLSR
jgi:hypothetical protein